MDERKRVLSLIQPSGVPTIGNYLGAFKNWRAMQENYDCLFGAADLHAITVRTEPKTLRENTRSIFALLLAVGIDPEKSVVFVQSRVPEHAQLAWLLNCCTQFGEAARMTQFKDKSATHADNINVGLFAYPTLMAADILLYQADYVPVGQDQKQHLELTRTIAERFNFSYGETFTVPEPFIGKSGARIMSLQEPSKKMSKSDLNTKAFISMLDEPSVITKKIKSAVTDSEAKVRFAPGKDGVNNLMDIYSCCTGKDYEAIEREFDGHGYGDFKNAVAEALVSELGPVQGEYKRLISDKAYIDSRAAEGSRTAELFARRTLAKAMRKMGFYDPDGR
ncbi:MAG: tryptophan--tRNA ligase [Clostridia bacterium]|nr:tryptophan--tRNA ligase [Clostridia bacterium]